MERDENARAQDGTPQALLDDSLSSGRVESEDGRGCAGTSRRLGDPICRRQVGVSAASCGVGAVRFTGRLYQETGAQAHSGYWLRGGDSAGVSVAVCV